jgi:hypothetical protein
MTGEERGGLIMLEAAQEFKRAVAELKDETSKLIMVLEGIAWERVRIEQLLEELAHARENQS